MIIWHVCPQQSAAVTIRLLCKQLCKQLLVLG